MRTPKKIRKMLCHAVKIVHFTFLIRFGYEKVWFKSARPISYINIRLFVIRLLAFCQSNNSYLQNIVPYRGTTRYKTRAKSRCLNDSVLNINNERDIRYTEWKKRENAKKINKAEAIEYFWRSSITLFSLSHCVYLSLKLKNKKLLYDFRSLKFVFKSHKIIKLN